MKKLKQWYLKRYTDYNEIVEKNKTLTENNRKLSEYINELIKNPNSFRSLSIKLLSDAKEANEMMMLNGNRKNKNNGIVDKIEKDPNTPKLGTKDFEFWQNALFGKVEKTPDLPEYYQTFKDKCTFCGACCRRAGKIPGFPEPVDENGVCVHLTKDNKCAIYDKRPLMCRTDDSFELVRFNYKDKRWYVKATIDRCNKMMDEDGIDKKFRIKQWNELTEEERKNYV